MTAKTHSTTISANCTVAAADGIRYYTGTFAVQTDIPSSPNALVVGLIRYCVFFLNSVRS